MVVQKSRTSGSFDCLIGFFAERCEVCMGMSAIMGLVDRDPKYRAFLKVLANKEDGKPLADWLESSDSLLVLNGEGFCNQCIIRKPVAQRLEAVIKEFPEKGEDPYAGFEILGIQAFLIQRYKGRFGSFFGQYVLGHNQCKYLLKASELVEWWLEKYPAEDLVYANKIRLALKRQNPQIHIPL